ncbi:hypothetical protein [Parvicella tangerina]|uniref:Lipoprotein n=1 Tax=Parvicella tangerina TaxID=2829795 RepID=A0A916JQT5_9FLAO|nr:hypothetical protein [Parvicella tangerina]CAG5087559.1 hypothetical protein CRYO30217_03513 [Parvicella tangerina]
MKRIFTLSILLVTLFLCACNKNQFEDDLAPLEGSFQWEFSYKLELVGLSYYPKYRYASQEDFSADIEFGDKNKVTFFVDGEEYLRKRFKVKDAYKENNRLYIFLKVDVNENQLDINDKLELVYWEDTLIVKGFPHAGYSGKEYGENYFVRK